MIKFSRFRKSFSRGACEGPKVSRIKFLGQTKILEILENFRLYGIYIAS